MSDAPSRLGSYVIERRLGAGGMGVVWLARDERLQRQVALKLVGERRAELDESKERLLREARLASALNHPHICTVYEVGEADGQSFIAMEFVDGRPLSEQIPEGGLPPETVLRLGSQLAEALAHAHDHGILHRDLKTSNLIVGAGGRLKVLDFGLAEPLPGAAAGAGPRNATTATAALGVPGTLQYMAPEVLEGRQADERSDLFSLGVVLYEMASGRRPFDRPTTFEIATAILRDRPPPLHDSVPPGLRAVILHCLAKDPAVRYRRAGEVAAALDAIVSSSHSGTLPVPIALRSRRRLSLAAFALAFVVTAGALAAFWLGRDRGTRREIDWSAPMQLDLLLAPQGDVSAPALSPDGSTVAYVTEIDGRFDLFVRRVAGGNAVSLTSDDEVEFSPAFSPDGERVAFARIRSEDQRYEVCIVPVLGGDVQPLVQDAIDPAWSPDGRRLGVVIRKPERSESLVTLATDGSDPRTVLEGDATYPFLSQTAWSPDGASLAITRSRGGRFQEIWLVAVDGGGPRRATPDPSGAFSADPVFTPDGLGIVHVSNRGGATNLWMQPLAGGDPVRLTSGAGPDLSPSVSRSGAIAFLNSKARGALVLHDLQGGTTRTRFSHPQVVWAPAFSPDGRSIAFSLGEPDGSWAVWRIPVDAGEPVRVAEGDLPQLYPRFLPDGRGLIYGTWSSQPDRIWLVPLDGGPARPITPARDDDDAWADPSPDGRSIVFSRAEQGTIRLYVMPLEGGAASRVTEGSGEVPRWSPDGALIAFARDRSTRSGIFLVRPDGSDERRLTDEGGWPVWLPDGRRLAFLADGPRGEQVVRLVALADGSIEALGSLHFNGRNHPIDFSPDGRTIATGNSQPLGAEIWLLRQERGHS